MVDRDLGEALGQAYVDRTFGEEGKQRMLKMVAALQDSLGKDIDQLDWMTPATKKEALIKLHKIEDKIGYPNHWRDYSSVKIVRGDALGNAYRSSVFELNRSWRDRQAGGPRRVGNDAAHGECLLRSAAEYGEFSGGNPAAAVLR